MSAEPEELSQLSADILVQQRTAPLGNESEFEMPDQQQPLKRLKNHYSQASNTFTNNTNTSNREPSSFDKEETKSMNSDVLLERLGLPKTKFCEKQREIAQLFQKFDRCLAFQSNYHKLKGRKQGQGQPGRRPENQGNMANAPAQIQPTATRGNMLRMSKGAPTFLTGPDGEVNPCLPRPRLICGVGRSIKIVGQIFITSRLEKNNYNGEAKQIIRLERIKAMNQRYTAKMQLERQLKMDGMKELVEKGELEEEEAEKLNQRRVIKPYHRLPTSIWGHADQKQFEASLRKHGKNLGKIAADFPNQSISFLSRRLFAMDQKVKKYGSTPHQSPFDPDIIEILKHNRETDRKLMQEQAKLRQGNEQNIGGLLLPGQEIEKEQNSVKEELDSVATDSEMLFSDDCLSEADFKPVGECDQKELDLEADIEGQSLFLHKTRSLLKRLEQLSHFKVDGKARILRDRKQLDQLSNASDLSNHTPVTIQGIQLLPPILNPEYISQGPTTRSRKKNPKVSLLEPPFELNQQTPALDQFQTPADFNPDIFNHIQNMISFQMQLNMNQQMQFLMPGMQVPFMFGFDQKQ